MVNRTGDLAVEEGMLRHVVDVLFRAARVCRVAVLLLVVMLAVGAGGVAWAQPINSEEKQRIIRETERLVREQAYSAGVDFDKWPQHQKKFQERLDSAKNVREFTMVVNEMLRQFGISHLDVLSPSMAVQSDGGQFSGIGVSLVEGGGGTHRIMQVLAGSPAEKAGIKVGDVITAADGKPLEDTRLLRGPNGSQIAVTVRRADGREATYTVTRGKVSFRTPESVLMIDDDTAVVRIPTFHSDYDRSNVTKVMKQVMSKKHLIIDLRDNSGGEVRNMLHFLGFLLPAGQPIGTSVSRDAAEAFKEQEGGDPLDLPAVAAWMKDKIKVMRNDAGPFKGQVAVLTNRNTASASEIIAQAMVELKGGVLVGTPTAGAVLVSTYQELPGGYRMKVPHSEYVTIKGRRIEGKPLQPDHGVVTRGGRDGTEKDPVTQTAVRLLRQLDGTAKVDPEAPLEQVEPKK